MKSGFIVRFLQKIRDAAQKTLAFFFVKVRDPQTGRLPVSNSSIRMIGVTLFFVFFVFIVINNYMKNHRNAGTLDDYSKEIQNDSGMVSRPIDRSDLFDTDPTKEVPYQSPSAAGAQSSASDMISAPGRDECFGLIQRMKDGEPNFSLQEQRQVDVCLAENTAGLSNEELAMAKAINDKTLTAEQRAAVRDQWAGNSAKLEKDPSLSALKTVMVPGGPEKASDSLNRNGAEVAADKIMDFARQVQNSGDKLASGALKKVLADKPIDSTEKQALGKFAPKSEPESSAFSFLGGGSASGKEAQLKEVTERIKAKQAELQNLKNDLADTQAQAREAAQKLAQGKLLSADESEMIRRTTDQSQKVAQLKADLAKDGEELRKVMDEIKEILADANNLTEEFPSGTFEMTMDDGKKITKRGKRKKVSASQPEKTVEQKLTVREVEAIRLKEMADELTDGTKVAGKLLNNDLFGKEPLDANKLVTTFNEKDVLCLRSSMKFAAVMDTEVLVPSGGNQQVRVRLLMDVYNSCTNKVALPKGTILIGSASSFNDETGVMEMTFTKASVGKKMYDFNMKVGSADGSMGLKGNIYDTRGRRLLAALITSFSSGVLNWFSQNVVAQYQDTKQASLAVTGAALGGAAEVGNKISAMYASDLNNAPTIFHCPRGTPLILYPEDQ